MTGGPLTGIHVLDLSRVLAAPYATMALGELGADVIKVERQPGGDETRQWGPPFLSGESTYFLSINRNKRSIALDMSQSADRAIVRDLALLWADVVVENFKPGTLERWGLGLAEMRALKPGLVTATVRGYPDPDDRPGYDFVIQAGSGLMSITGPIDGDPSKVGVAVADITTGLFLVTGIEAALYQRERTGRGDHVTVSLFESQLAWLANVGQSYLSTGSPPQRYGNAHAQLAPYQTLRTKDGLIAIGVGNDGQFRALAVLMGHPEWAEDVRFRTNPDRVRHREDLVRTLEAVLMRSPTHEWVALLEDGGVAAGPVRTIPEALEHAQQRGHGVVGAVEHQTLGSLNQIRLPWHFDEHPAQMGAAPPVLDQHRDEILALIADLRRQAERTSNSE